jgi:hypothetical protein
MFRFGWRTFIAINLVAYIPVGIVTAVVAFATYGATADWEQLFTGALRGNGNLSQAWAAYPWWTTAVTIVASILAGAFSAVGQAALIDAIATTVGGGKLSARNSGRVALTRLPSVLAVYVVVSFIGIAAALLGLAVPLLSALPSLGITGGPVVFLGLVVFVAVIAAVIFVTIRFTFALMALVVERLSAGQALRRSWHLLAGSMLRLIGWAIVFGLIVAVISFVISFIGLFIALIVSPPRLGDLGSVSGTAVVTETLVNTLVSALFAPFITVGLTLLYFEIRWRHGEPVPVPGQPTPG